MEILLSNKTVVSFCLQVQNACTDRAILQSRGSLGLQWRRGTARMVLQEVLIVLSGDTYTARGKGLWYYTAFLKQLRTDHHHCKLSKEMDLSLLSNASSVCLGSSNLWRKPVSMSVHGFPNVT